MEDLALLTRLTELTGALTPSGEGSAPDLRAARASLALALARGQEQFHAAASVGTSDPVPDVAVRAELEQIVAEMAAQPDLPLNALVFRRELPVSTTQHAASVPAWAVGLEASTTLGPFTGTGGRPFWFDIFRIVHQVIAVQLPGGSSVLSLPIRGPVHPGATHRLGAGSIWIPSRLLAPSAPPGSFTGLRIRGGTLHVSIPATVAAGALQIPPGASMKLTLHLNPPVAAAGPGTGPGGDGADVVADLPVNVTFRLEAGQAAEISADPASVRIYGETIPMRQTGASAAYEPELSAILVPFETSRATLTVAASRSDLFRPTGVAPIIGCAWALPVAITSAATLGVAAGVGALVVKTGPGLQADWLGVQGGTVPLNATFFLVQPGELAVTALQAQHRRATQTLELWNESSLPRRASIEMLYPRAFPLRFLSLKRGVEVLLVTGTAVAHLDRPVRADGGRLGITISGADLFLFEDAVGLSVTVIGSNPAPVAPKVLEEPLALALVNALLKTSPPRLLTLFGQIDPALPSQVRSGDLHLHLDLYLILPTLPDPYAANFSVPPESRGSALAKLDSHVHWSAPETQVLSFAFLPLNAVSTSTHVLLPAENTARGAVNIARGAKQLPSQQIALDDANRIDRIRAIFDETVNGAPETLFLLDVSSNADLLGVCLGFGRRQRDEPAGSGTASPFPIAIDALELVTAGSNVRLFTVPQVQWEPVRTVQNPDVGSFPNASYTGPLFSADDGGPTRIGVNTVDLVPISPRPVLEQIVEAFNRDTDNRHVGALFTLPFGMMAVADLLAPADRTEAGAFMGLNQHRFTLASQTLDGGLQLQVTAYSPDDSPDAESPTLAGATIQLRNGQDNLGFPLFKSVLDDTVDTIFNAEFAPLPDGKNPRVPVTRIDFSGYGASLFSNWTNPAADPPATVQVRFDVFVGRTAYEVVKVKSILYPWGVVVVRTVTIERTEKGGVIRHDSGWVAATSGEYKLSGLTSHPGVVKGIFNVREIRDTAVEHKDGGVELRGVTFDGDLLIENVRRGASGNTALVPTVGQFGFVQTKPINALLTPVQYQTLLQAQGPLGGPIDCVIDIGGSGQVMRVTRVDVSTALTGALNPVFVAAARGALTLPRAGSWSVTRQLAGSPQPQAVDPHVGVPLIRQGEATLPETANGSSYRIADPGDLMQPDSPAADYALLQSSGTERLLFPRPKIEKGDKRITSTQAPLLADPYALAASVGIFPKLQDCFAFAGPGGYGLEIPGEGHLRLRLVTSSFLVPAGVTRQIIGAPPNRLWIDYSDGKGRQTTGTVTVDSTASPSWTVSMSPVSVVLDLDPFPGLTRTISRMDARDGQATQYVDPQMAFSPVLQPVIDVFKVIGGLSPAKPLSMSMSNDKTVERKWEEALDIPINFPPDPPKGAPEPPPAPLVLDADLQLGYYSKSSSDSDLQITASGGFFQLGGAVMIMVFSIGIGAIYAVGHFKVEISWNGRRGRTLELQLAVGIGAIISVPVLGKISAYIAVGIQITSGQTEVGTEALLVFTAKVELFEVIQITIDVEAKGGTQSEAPAGDPAAPRNQWETSSICELSLAVEVHLFLILDVSFEVTWQDKRRIS
jgi:hypothetical protein